MRENVEHVEVVALSTGSHKEVTTACTCTCSEWKKGER